MKEKWKDKKKNWKKNIFFISPNLFPLLGKPSNLQISSYIEASHSNFFFSHSLCIKLLVKSERKMKRQEKKIEKKIFFFIFPHLFPLLGKPSNLQISSFIEASHSNFFFFHSLCIKLLLKAKEKWKDKKKKLKKKYFSLFLLIYSLCWVNPATSRSPVILKPAIQTFFSFIL